MGHFKKLNEQTIVITGASSGIGLATARLAAKEGARLVLVSRNEDELRRISDELRADGVQVVHVAGDVGNEAQVRNVVDQAIASFGGFDTWVNNAGVSIYGKLLEVPIDDHRRLFETDYWGVVYGSLEAVRHLRGKGGVLINVGSIVSTVATPLQGAYAAAKHAVKGFTDSLRQETEHDDIPVAICLIRPGSIDTPFPQHARNYLGAEAELPPPVYAPEVVARAILDCAVRPRREITVGGGGKGMTLGEKIFPRFAEKIGERALHSEQKRYDRPRTREDALWSPPVREGAARGGTQHHVARSSLYTSSRLHPARSLGFLALAGGAGFLATRAARQRQRSRELSYAPVPTRFETRSTPPALQPGADSSTWT